MNLKRITGLADKAKHAFEEHGGTDRLKEEAGKLKDIATGPGTAKDKVKAAGDTLRQRDDDEPTVAPAAHADDDPPAAPPDPATPPPAA